MPKPMSSLRTSIAFASSLSLLNEMYPTSREVAREGHSFLLENYKPVIAKVSGCA